MTIYEIDKAILDCQDSETGEITDFAKLDALQMAREAKIENIACWIKDLQADAKALKEEEQNLADRRRAAEHKAESLKNYLTFVLNGEKFKSPRAQVSFRRSQQVYIEDETKFTESHPEYVKVKKEIDRAGVKSALKEGEQIEGACLEEHQNIQIK